MVLIPIEKEMCDIGSYMGIVITPVCDRQERTVSGANAWEHRGQCHVRQHAPLVQQPHEPRAVIETLHRSTSDLSPKKHNV